MRDIHSISSASVAIAAAALDADNTPPAVSLAGFDAAEIVIAVGVGGISFSDTNKIEFVLTHSDDDETYDEVEDADMLGVDGIEDGIIKALTSAHAAAAVYRFGYIGGRRYLKLLADFDGTHGEATPIAASVIRMRPSHAPTADQA